MNIALCDVFPFTQFMNYRCSEMKSSCQLSGFVRHCISAGVRRGVENTRDGHFQPSRQLSSFVKRLHFDSFCKATTSCEATTSCKATASCKATVSPSTGVHRGVENTGDVSADLTELARTPLTVNTLSHTLYRSRTHALSLSHTHTNTLSHTHSLTLSLPHSLIHSLTHSLTHTPHFGDRAAKLLPRPGG